MNHKSIHTVLRIIMFPLLWWFIACGIAGSPSSPAIRPALSLSTSSINFGRQTVRTPATTMVTVTNTGTANLVMSQLKVAGANAADFACAAGTLPMTLAPQHAASLQVTFIPAATGDRAATLNIVQNASDTPLALALSGTGIGPGIRLSTSSLTFADQYPNTRSVPATVTIANPGTANLVISQLAITGADAGDFTFSAQTLPLTIIPGFAATVAVTFTPAQAGARSAALAITDNASATPHVVTLSGSSPGVTQNPAASVAISPSSGQAGSLVTVTFQGNLTNFVPGATMADFGPGTITGAGDGLLTVTSPVSATAQVRIQTQAAPGPRQIVISTGGHHSYVTFRVLSAQAAAVANAGPQQFAAVGSTVQLDGTRSTCTLTDNPLGCLLSFQWSFLELPEGSAAQLSDAGSVNPSFGIDEAGDYIVQLSAQPGGAGVPSSGTLASVVISTQGTSPVASAGPNQLVATGSNVQLDGSGSSHASGQALSYQWMFLSVPEGSAATLSDVTSVAPTFVADVAGTYELQLTVYDGQGNNASDTVLVGTQGVPPVARAGNDQTVPVGSTAELDGSQSLAPGGGALHYQWEFTFRPAGSTAPLAGANTAKPSFVVDQIGSYGLQLTVSDDLGNSATGTVMVSTDPVRPVAIAGAAQSLPAGGTVQLDGSESTGAPTSYQWYLINKPAASAAALNNSTQARATFTADVAGFYVAELVVTGNGLTSYPATVLITATAPGFAAAPNAVSFGNQTIGLTSDSQSVLITNHGTGALTIGHLAIAGTNAAAFAYTAPGLPTSVPPGGSATVYVTFTPAAAGTAAAVLNVGDNAAGAPHAVALSGAGVVGPAASITAVAGSGQSATIGTSFTPLQVLVEDAGGNAVSGATVAFTAPASGASGSFGSAGNTAVTNAQGIASAAFLSNHKAGSYTVTATVAGVSTPASFTLANLAGVPATITATAGDAQGTPVNTAFATALQATVVDSGGNPVSGATVTFTAPASGASGSFAGGGNAATAVTDSQGVATAPVLTANSVAGSYAVTASVGSATAVFSLTNQAGAPAALTAVAGTPQSATIQTAFATALQARVKDADGNAVSGVTVTFTTPASGASASFGGSNAATAVTNAQGLATAPLLTANSAAGNYLVTASTASLTATFALTNQPGAPASMTALAGTPQSTAIQTVFATALQVLVKDAGGNAVSGVTVTFNSPASGASASFAGSNSAAAVTNALGVANAPALTAGGIAGSYVVTASAGVASATFALTNQVGAPASMTAMAGTPQSATINTTFATALQATVKDAGGNAVSGVTVTFTTPASGASASFAGSNLATAVTNAQGVATAPALKANSVAGGYVVTASAASLTATFALTNQAGAPATLTALAGTPQSTTIQTVFATALQALVKDAGGNAVSGVTVTFTTPASGASAGFAGSNSATVVTNAQGIATAPVLTANSVAGNYVVTAGAAGLTAAFALSNQPGAPATLTALAGTPQSATINTAFAAPFQAMVKDAGGNAVSGVTVTFTTPASGAGANFAGSNSATAVTNAQGVAIAPVLTANSVAGNYVVTASAAGLTTAFALTNQAGAPATLTALAGTPQSAIINTAFAAPLQAMVKDAGGNAVSGVTVTFTTPASGAGAGFAGSNTATAVTNTQGIATAPVLTANIVAGNYTVTANAGGLAATFALTNDPGAPATLTAVAGTPQNATIQTAFATALQALVKDAGGNAVSGVTVIFAAPANGASAGFAGSSTTTAVTNAQGVATAPALTANSVAGSYVVTASAAGLTATFALTNRAGAPASVTAVAGAPQSVLIGTAYALPLQVVVKDAGGNLLSGVTVTFTTPANGASASFATGNSATAPTSAQGVATAPALTANNTGGPFTVTAAVSGVSVSAGFALTNLAPVVSINPAAVAFGNQALRSTSAPLPVVIGNTGTGNLVITSLAITGSEAVDYSFAGAGALPLTVAPGASTTVNVTFAPAHAGSRAASLVIIGNAGGSPQTVPLTGTGIAVPVVNLSTAGVTFGPQLVYTASTPLPLTIANNGTADLVITSLILGGTNVNEFSLAAAVLPVTVSAGNTTTISLTFSPGAAGTRAATLTIVDNAAGSPRTVPLTGTGTAPVMNVAPAALTFPQQTLQSASAPATLTVSNTGNGNLVITTLTLTGANSGDFTLTAGTLPITVAPGASTALSVVFTPRATGTRAATLLLAGNTANPQTVAISGSSASAPAVSLTPTSLNFGPQLLYGTSTPLPVMIGNSGTANLVISSLTLTGANGNEFSLEAANPPITVGPGSSTTVNVLFTPGAAGTRTATLSIADNATGSPHTVALTGTGTAPAVTITPAALNFAGQLLQSASVPATLTVSNSGNGNLVITTLTLLGASSGDFTLTAGPLPITVAPGGNATLSLVFTPRATGARAATLMIADNAGDSPQLVTLAGTGTAPGVSIAPGVISFGSQLLNQPQAASQTVAISNTGTGALAISALTVTGANNGDFSVSAPALPITVAPGGAAKVNVLFAPTATGLRAAALNVISNAGSSPDAVPLAGTGTATTISINPSTLDLGNTTVNAPSVTRYVSLSNLGNANLVVSNVAISGANAADFSYSFGPLPVSISPMGISSIAIVFTPSTTGTRSATLTITDNASGSPHTVALTGTGTQPVISLAPASIGFGSQQVTAASLPAPVTIGNSGTANLVISGIAITGANAADFSYAANMLPLTVTPGGTATVNVTFTPAAAGARAATISFTDNAAGNPHTLALSGTGVAPGFGAAPGSVLFGSVPINTSSSATPVTISNTGTANLVISGIALAGTNPGDFTFTAGTLPITVAAGGNTIVNVTFTPAALGSRAASLTVTDNAAGSPHTVALSGTGANAAGISLTPAGLNFGNQAVGSAGSVMQLTASNTGTSNLVISNFAITGTNAADFSYTAGTLPITVAAGGSTIISVTFTPAAAGYRGATLSLTDTAPGSPQSVTLSGTGTAPVVTLSPASLSFGSQAVNTASALLPVTISNTGTASLVISQLALAGTNSGDFTMAAAALPITVTPGNSTTVAVTFKPAAAGARSAALNITDNAAGSPHSVPLSGTGTSSSASMSMPSSLDLGSIPLNTSSAPKPVTIINTGATNLVISAIALSGLNAGEFTFSAAPLPVTVSPGGMTSINITFTPAGVGLRSATMTVTDNAAGSPQSVALTGTGAGTAVIGLAPASVNFNGQDLGTTSAPSTVMVSNTGANNLVISGLALLGSYPGDFAYSAGALPITVAPGGSAAIRLTFTPSALGARAATLQLVDNANGSPHSVPLSGNGVVPTIGINPTSVTFANQTTGTTSSPSTVTLSNTSTGQLVISNLSLSGANAADFALAAVALPVTLAAGGSLNVNLTFTPAANGARAATLSVADNVAGSPQTVSLAGTGIPPAPGIALSPASLSFGNQPVNTTSAVQALTISNPGTANLSITNLSVAGANATDFTLGALTLPISVSPGGKTTLQVAFTPGAAGNRAATLNLTDNASGSPQSVALSGTGTVPGFSVSPGSLNFGNQTVSVPTAASLLTVTNTGTASLVISNLLITGANAGDYTFTAATLPVTVAAGGTTTISVVFTPGGSGARSATLNVTDNASGSPHTVALSGNGMGSGANININPTTLTFGNQNTNTTSAPASFSIVNTGTGNLVLSALAITGANAADFALTAVTLPVTVSPQGLSTLSVTFTPTAGGTRSATLSITDNANGSPHVVTLSGTGIVQSAAISLNPTSVNFGSQTVGTSSGTSPVVVTNTGTANLTISSLAITGANPGDFAVASSPLPITVLPGGAATLYTTFTPSAGGSRAASLSIGDNANGTPHTVPLSGTGATPVITLNPSSVAFGSQLALTTSAPVSVVIGNTGTGNLVITSLAITPPAVQFQFTANSLPITVAPGNSTTVKVTFSPSALGAYSSALVIASNAAGSPQAVSLTGTGTAPAMTANPASLNFGNQLTGTASAASVLTLTNSGTANLVISNLTITGTNGTDFSFASGTLPITVTPGNSTAVNVTFKPAAAGGRSATLNINDNISGSPQTVAITGTGTLPGIAINPTSLAFGNQAASIASAALPLTLANNGTANLVIANLAVVGLNASDFTFTSGALPITVAPGSSTTVNVTFTPAATGSRTALLNVSDNVSGSPQAVTLTGTGVAPAVSLSSASLSFGNQLVASTSTASGITVTNSGTGNLVISNLSITGTNSGDFALTAGTLPITVAPGANTTISVTFTPTATGSRTATLNIYDNAIGSPQAVALTGTGTQPIVSLSTTSLNYGSQGVGTSTPLGVTVTNSGTGNLVISLIAIGGTNASDFTFTATGLPITVTPGGNTIITVTYKPTTALAETATLTITDSANGSPHSVALSGTGTAPVVNFSPVSMAFGNQLVNTASNPSNLVINNTGSANLVITAMTITGTNATDFSYTAAGAFPLTITPGNRTYLALTFQPAAAGNRTATLMISDNGIGSPQAVPLSGTGTSAVISVAPATIGFGNQAVGTSSAATPVVVSNSGTGSLVISSLTIAGANSSDFAYQAGTLPITVTAGGTATINVTFKPTAPGSRSAGLNIVDNAVGSPQTVALTGTGVGPLAVPSPSSVAFGSVAVNGSSSPSTVTISNTGNANLVISSLAITGVNSGDFSMTSSATPITVAPGGTTAVVLKFQPKAGGSRAASLSITSNAAGSPLLVPLSGVATGTGLLGMPAVTVGGNLEVLATATLTIGPPSDVTVTVTSGSPNLVLLSTDTSGKTAGSSSVTVTIKAGTTAAFPGFYVQGLASSGTVTLTLSASGFATATATVTLSPSGFVLASPGGTGVNFSTTLGAANTTLTVAATQLDGSNNVVSSSARIRGGYSVTVPVTSATPSVGTVVGSATFQGGDSSSSGASFQPAATGSTVLSAGAPVGFSVPTTQAQLTATVVAPQISLFPTTVGVNLETQGSGQLTVAAPASGLQVTLTSQTPGTVLLATSPTATGASSIILTVGPGSTALPTFYVQGVVVGSGQLVASAPGYGFDTSNFNGDVAITPSGVVISGPSGIVGQAIATTTISNSTTLTLTVMRLDGAGNQVQIGQVRGGVTLSAAVQSGTTSVGTISGGTAKFNGGDTSNSTILFNPVGPGHSVLTVVQPAGFSPPSSGGQLTANVSQPQISLILPVTTIGKNLQIQASGSLNASAPAAMNITISSGDASKVMLSALPGGPAAASISVPIGANSGLNGVGFPTYYVQGLAASGTVTLTASAQGWASGTIVVTLTPSGFVLIGPNGTGQNFGSICAPASCPSTTLAVQAMQLDPGSLAPQNAEELAGGLTVNVTIGNTVPSVGSLTGAPVAMTGGTSANTFVFQPLSTGSTKLTAATPAGFSTPSTGASLNASVN